MKKILLAFIVVLAFTACKGDEGPMGPPGNDGVGSYWIPTEFIIQPNQWKLEGNPDAPGSHFYVDVDLKELKDDIFYDGIVVGYMAVALDNQDFPTVKQVLPYTTPLVEGSRNYTRTYDFDYEIGAVRFYLTYSDFKTSVRPSETQYFYIIIAY